MADDFRIVLQGIIDSIKTKENINKSINRMQNLDKLKIKAELDSKAIQSLTSQIQKIVNQKITISNINVNPAQAQNVGKQIGKQIGQLSQVDIEIKTERATQRINALKVEAQKLNSSIDFSKLDSAFATANTDKTSESFKKVELEVIKVKAALDTAKTSAASAAKSITDLQRTKMSTDIEKWLSTNTHASKQFREQMEKLKAECMTCDDVRFKNIGTELASLKNQASILGQTGKSALDTLSAGMKKFTEWGMATRIVMGVIQAVKDMASNVKLLDDSLLELSKVSDLSVDGLQNITDEAYELGETVGKTGTQVINAVTEFKRAGYELSDSMDMAKAALVMTNVAEGITETADAAGTLISVLKGYNMNESSAMSIVDMMNSTSNQSPIGFDELAEGLERTAGTMAQSGTSIQQTIGLITAGFAQLRNVEKVSTSLITLSARLRGVDEDGEVIDGLSAELQESFGKIGIAIEDADGNLRNIYEIAQDYSKVLPTLTSKQKQYYAELAAGKRNVTTWNAITQSFTDAEKATSQAIDSIGSASEENEKYLNSLSGRIEMFKSSFEQLSNTVLNSDLLKFFVDLGTTGVSAFDGLSQAISPLGALAVTGGSLVGITEFIKNLD